MHSFHIPLSQFRVGFHRLQVETDHQIDRSDRICQLCHLLKVETEELHFLLRGTKTLTSLLRDPDQRCLAQYIQEPLRLRTQVIQPLTRPYSTRKILLHSASGRGTQR